MLYNLKDKVLVVLCLLQGRKFPRRAHYSIAADARFDGEILTSDPVDHVNNPEFAQELAWEIDKRALHYLKAQKSSIEIKFYCQQTNRSQNREVIGYVTLDIKKSLSCSLKQQCSLQSTKWYTLLQTMYIKSKPEIQLGLFIDDREQTGIMNIVDQPRSFKPILNASTGCYEIGSTASGTENQFVFSVVVALAANLTQLLHDDSIVDATSGYFFYYNLIDLDVTTEVFFDLSNPKFKVDRTYVKIIGDFNEVKNYFSEIENLEIHLCCKSQVLGSCHVPVKNLIDSDFKINSIEGVFQILPPNSPINIKVIADELKPILGIAIELKIDNEITAIDNPAPIPDTKISLASFQLDVHPKSTGNLSSDTKLHENAVYEYINLSPDSNDTQCHDMKNSVLQFEHGENVHGPEALETAIHHYNLSIDLRMLSNFIADKPLNIYLRYAYSFFGNAQPITTFPWVEIKPGLSTVKVHHSFCSLDFATSYKELLWTFTQTPLIVEVCQADIATTQIFGIVEVDLSRLLVRKNQQIISGNKVCEICQCLPIISSESKKPLGNLDIFLKLEDFGSLRTEQLFLSSTPLIIDGKLFNNSDLNKKEKCSSNKDKFYNMRTQTDFRQSIEYKMALELEIWKEQQKKRYEEQMEERVKSIQTIWENEYKLRERERMVLLYKQKEEYDKLKENLRTALNELEKREKMLSTNEKLLQIREENIKRDYQSNVNYINSTMKISEVDFENKISSKRSKVRSIDELSCKLTKQLEEWELRHSKLNENFESFKKRLNQNSEIQLQETLKQLMSEKTGLMKQLESLNHIKQHYKMQWTKALKIIGKYKERDLYQARNNCKKHEDRVKSLKIKMAVGKEKEALENEKLELMDVKKHINGRIALEIPINKIDADEDKNITSNILDCNNLSNNLRVTRLAKEKDLLLRTGMYTAHDSVILNLEDQIKQCFDG